MNEFRKRFDEYDCLNVFNNYRDIDLKDIIKCWNFLGINQKENNLSLDEQIVLRLIVLFGIRNVYFNTSKFYKDQNSQVYYQGVESIIENIKFINDNKNNIEEEFNGFKLKKYLNNKYDEDLCILRKIYLDSYLQLCEICLYISFEYYISIEKYPEAQNLLENNSLILFGNIDNIFEVSDKLGISLIDWFFEEFLVDYNLIKNDLFEIVDKIELNGNLEANDIEKEVRVLRITPILKFLISYYYYLRFFNKEKSEKLYSILLLFENGFEIEEFINKCKYEKMVEEMEKYKSDSLKEGDAEESINIIHERIQEKQLIDSYELENIHLIYPYILFENLNERVKKYIATGDKIIKVFDGNNCFDYSCAVIEWSKAVELEINEKLIEPIAKYKSDIETYANSKGYHKPFVINTKNTTIGFFKAIRDYNIEDYLYMEYFSKLYTFSLEEYNLLCDYINLIIKPRNESAHKDNSINIITAKECKEKILAANRILEIFSKLKKVNT